MSDEIPCAPRIGLLKLLDCGEQHVLVGDKMYVLRPGHDTLDIPVHFEVPIFCRFLAKVAHAFVHDRGILSCGKWYLPSIILGDGRGALNFIGRSINTDLPIDMVEDGVHRLGVSRIRGQIVVTIELFCSTEYITPHRYAVVVGADAKLD
jgi:hypothetical protein